MANITKRANKRAADHLGGDTLEVAVLCEMKGQLGVGMVALVIARSATERVLRNRAAGTLEGEGGLAAAFPAETCAVGLSATTFYAFPSNGIRFKEPTLVIDRSSVGAEVVGRKGFGKRVAFTFVDGSQAQVDVGPGQPLDQLVDGLPTLG